MKLIEGLTAEEQRAAAVFRAMGNPARVRIVRELSERGSCTTGDLVELLPLAQSTISQHLKVLKDAGIVLAGHEADGCYCLDPDVVRWLSRWTFEICCPHEACVPAGADAGCGRC